MSGQKFCSFLYVRSAEPAGDEDLLRYLPTRTAEVELIELGMGRLYLSPGSGNPLHRNFIAHEGGFDFFLQGEFYEETSGPPLESIIREGEVDLPSLASYVESLNGAFSGFLVQRETGDCWGFNDRFGIGHLYVTNIDSRLLLASSLWPALMYRPAEREWYPAALQEILLFGYPLRDRTPLRDTRIVQPGLILSCRGSDITHEPYHSYDRLDVDDGRDVIGEFRQVAGEHMASIAELTGSRRFGSTLSGGHDSRVVVNAMLAQGIKPNCYVGYDNHPTWDSDRGGKVASAGGLPVTVFDYQEYAIQDWVDANVLADGSGTASWSMNLGKRSAEADDCLYFGTSGDPVSGGWKIFPHDFADVETMAKAMMKAYYHEYSTPQSEFLEIFGDSDPAVLMEKFTDSFAGGKDLVSAFLINFYREGNFRRVRMFMQGAYLYSTPVHFFHDRRIYEFYSRLPYRSLVGQRVHNRLCYLSSWKMGLVPASNFPIPVMLEPWLLPLAKRMLSSKIRTRMRPLTRKSVTVRAPLNPDVARCLESVGPVVGIDPAGLQAIVAKDVRSGVLALRAAYVTNMLDPEALLARSTLIGPKVVRRSERPDSCRG